MSGWIKMEKDLREDPRFTRMVNALIEREGAAVTTVTQARYISNAAATRVLGGLLQLWMYADSHIREDDTLDLGADEIDQLIGLKGFVDLMPTDWLEIIDANRVKLPSFHAHNGTEAKKKALTQKRVARHRIREAVTPVAQEKRSSVTPALPDQTRPDQTKTREEARDVPRETGFDGWEFIDQRMRPNYPAGQYPPTAWINAARTVERLHLEQGVRLEDIEAGAKRFLAACQADGSVGSRFVVNPDRFLAEARYTLPYMVTVQQGKPGEDSEAVQAWEKLLATDGAERSPQVHQALQAIGGWPRVRERTSKDTAFLRRDFIAAYSNARAAA